MTTKLNQLAKEVMLIRKNYGAPEQFALKERVKTRDMNNKIITVDCIVVSNQVQKKKNDNGEYETVMTKDGSKPIYQPVVYIGFDKDKYFVTKSQLLVRQLERLTDKTLVYYDAKDIVIDELNNSKIKVSSDKVRYGDGEEYEQIIFNDAE